MKNRFKVVHCEVLKYRFPEARTDNENDVIIFQDTVTGVLYLGDRFCASYTVLVGADGKPLTSLE